MTIFTTWGAVRRDCGHVHPTIQDATECVETDRAECRTARGYSDRYVTTWPLPTLTTTAPHPVEEES